MGGDYNNIKDIVGGSHSFHCVIIRRGRSNLCYNESNSIIMRILNLADRATLAILTFIGLLGVVGTGFITGCFIAFIVLVITKGM